MKDSLIYIVEVALCLNLLYWIYRQFLSELSFFSWSRFFFLFAIATAFAVPLFDLPLMPFKVSPKTFFAYAADGSDRIFFFHKAPRFEASPISSLFEKIVFGIYIAGAGWFLFKITREIVKVYHKQKFKSGDGVQVSDSPVPAWSFFQRVIINEEVNALAPEERDLVIQHEQTHGKQLHSIDTLLVELATALLWFNPLMPKIKREVVALHEYLADAQVVKRNNTQQYSRLILKLSGKRKAPKVSAAFNNSLVAARITMLNRPPESELKKFRFLLAVPLIAVLLVSFSMIEHVLLGKVNPSALSTSEWEFPLTKQFVVIKPYSEKEEAEWGNIRYELSHKRVSIVAQAHQNVLSPAKAKVLNVWENNRGGVLEKSISLELKPGLVFVIEGLADINAKKGETVERAEKIGKTGKRELYPSVRLELWRGETKADPLQLFE